MLVRSRPDVTEEQTRCCDLAQTERSTIFPSSLSLRCSCVCWGEESMTAGGERKEREERERREGGGYGHTLTFIMSSFRPKMAA